MLTLCIDTKGILIVVPGVAWRPVNLVVTSIVFLWISHKVAEATGELTKFVCGIKPVDLPTVAAPLDVTQSAPHATARREETPRVDFVGEESIPLVEHTELVLDDATAEKLAPSPITRTSIQVQQEHVPPEQSGSLDSAQTPSIEEGNAGIILARSPFDQPLSLPIRVGVLIVIMWLVNLAWPSTALHIL